MQNKCATCGSDISRVNKKWLDRFNLSVCKPANPRHSWAAPHVPAK